MIYFYSYVWQSDTGPKFECEVTKRHPLLITKDWNEEYNGNKGSRLISWQEIDTTGMDDELTNYLNKAIADNYGEL